MHSPICLYGVDNFTFFFFYIYLSVIITSSDLTRERERERECEAAANMPMMFHLDPVTICKLAVHVATHLGTPEVFLHAEV
jgi:hypothetical protein